MKSFLKSALGLALGVLLASSAAQAQVRVNVNIGAPTWGPAVGPNVEYYYIPEIDGYYDIYSQQYVYLDNGYWVASPYLPQVYAGYDPRYFHPIVIDYVGRNPWSYIGNHRSAYYSRYGYASAPGWRYPVHPRVYGNGRPPVIVNRPYGGGYNPGYGRGYDNRNGYVDNRGYNNRSYDNRVNNNRVPDNRNNDYRGNDNRGNDNRNNDYRGNDNRRADNDNGADRGRGGEDNRGGRSDDRGGSNGDRGRGRIR